MKFILIAGFLLATADAGLVEDFFGKAFEQIRPTLKDIQIDTLTVESLELNNLAIAGLDQFNHTTLSVQILPLKIKNLTINVDNVVARSAYKMNSLTIPNLITLSGAGDLKLEITGITLYTKATLASTNRVITIKNLEEISVYLDEIKIDITGLAGGGPVGDFLNQLFNLVGTRFVNMLATPLLNENRAKLVPYINQILSKIIV